MANGIRIDDLDATVLPSRDHVVPAMKDGLTVKLTVGQILDLLGKVLDPDGVGSKALFAALNLSDLDDPEQARSNIGVVLQSSATDTTAGRVLTVGAFGIGAQRIEVEIDLDNYTVSGFYITPASGLTNLPAGWSQARHILIVSGGTSYTLQI